MSISPKLALLEEYALVARALSAPARLMLLEQLAQGERGVEALAEKTGLTIANCSQHLQQLRRAALVTSRRDGKAVIYRLTDAKTLELMDLLRIVAERNWHKSSASCGASRAAMTRPNRSVARSSPHGSRKALSLFSMSGPPTNTLRATSPVRGTPPWRSWSKSSQHLRMTPRLSPIAAAHTASMPIRPSPLCAATV